MLVGNIFFQVTWNNAYFAFKLFTKKACNEKNPTV